MANGDSTGNQTGVSGAIQMAIPFLVMCILCIIGFGFGIKRMRASHQELAENASVFRQRRMELLEVLARARGECGDYGVTDEPPQMHDLNLRRRYPLGDDLKDWTCFTPLALSVNHIKGTYKPDIKGSVASSYDSTSKVLSFDSDHTENALADDPTECQVMVSIVMPFSSYGRTESWDADETYLGIQRAELINFSY